MRFCKAVLASLALCPGLATALNVSASLETKFQVDNRFTETPTFLGELWGDARLISIQQDWQLKVSAAHRFSSLSHDTRGKLFQGFIEKHFDRLDSHLRLGRFQRADVAGFYLVDGVQFDYRLNGWFWQFYGGSPHRIDHVQSIDGDSIFGVDGLYQRTLDWRWQGLKLTSLTFRTAFQQFRDSRTSRRLNGGIDVTGELAGRAYQTGLNATYRFDRERFEDVYFNFRVDLTETLRFRSNYEYYRPRSPFPTFRERFVSAFTLGEQSLFRAELHRRPGTGIHYYLGGQRATKADGEDGFGLRIGADAALPWELTFNALYDFLELGRERAHSLYGGFAQLVNSRLEWHLNGALRKEDKLLYGVNWARGAEVGGRYLIDYSKVLILSLSYIANSRRRDDYVGTVRFVYYFDRFEPKK